MSDTMFLVPKPGTQVRDPVTAEPLPESGAAKPRTAYWFRRLRDGDVQEAQVSRAQGGAGATDVQEAVVAPQESAPKRVAADAPAKNKQTKE